MFPDRPPFHYKCKNCGYFFTTDEKLNAPSELSLISLDFDENTEIDENGNVKSTIKSDKKPLSKKNSMELKELAKELGIEGYESLTNKELIAVIKEAQSNGN